MAGLFLSILSMSLTGSAVILAVLLARVCLRRAPKKVSYLLWIPVAFRLICPVSFSTPTLRGYSTTAGPSISPRPRSRPTGKPAASISTSGEIWRLAAL